MTQQHTPAPWNLSPFFSKYGMTDNNGSVVVMAGGERDASPIAHALLTVEAKRGAKHTAADPVRDANARLIAAAPELLAAVSAIIDCHNRGATPSGWRAAVEQCKRAAGLAGVLP